MGPFNPRWPLFRRRFYPREIDTTAARKRDRLIVGTSRRARKNCVYTTQNAVLHRTEVVRQRVAFSDVRWLLMDSAASTFLLHFDACYY